MKELVCFLRERIAVLISVRSSSVSLRNYHCLGPRPMAARGSVRSNDDILPRLLAYHVDGKEKAVLFMKNCTTFTAPFKTDLGYMLQLVTEQWSLGVYMCFCAAGVDSCTNSVLFLHFNGTFHSATEML